MEKAMNINNTIAKAIPLLINFPESRFKVDYDQEADVLYISFKRPQKATNTEMTDNGILFRYRKNELVGITVLEASTRTGNSLTTNTVPAE